jgi:hypothetical protein
MALQVSYPCMRPTMEPRAMRATEIWLVADQVRHQLTRGRPLRRLAIEQLRRDTCNMIVNGIPLKAHWDLDRSVRDGVGREALGVTEADRAVPGALLISLNGSLIGDREYLMRSTVAHELGHMLFDGPAMLRRDGRERLAMVTLDEGHLSRPPRTNGQIDWREFRANEFMGALLVPSGLLHRAATNVAIGLGMRLLEGQSALPLIDASRDAERFEHLVLDLGEQFGVSADFISYRLRRYALVH